MFIIFLLAVLILFLRWYMQCHDKLLHGLPQLQWMTIEFVTSEGHTWIASSSWLPVFHQRGQLEIKPLTPTGVWLLEKYEPARAFCMRRIHHFEFKLIEGPSRRRTSWLASPAALAA